MAYKIMGLSLHRCNGLDPAAGTKLIETYVVPLLIYGLNVVVFANGSITELSQYY